LKNLIAYINKNVLVKVTPLEIVSLFVKLISGILTSKAIAIFIGVEGLALIGNLRNFVSSFQTISIFGLYNGTVKYIAKFKNNTLRLSQTLSTVFYIGFFATILVSFFCYFNAEAINNFIFPTYNNYPYVIKIFAIVLPFYALNMFSFSIMNGFSNYKMLIIVNIIGQILGLSITLILIYQNQIEGALISIAIAEALICLITLVSIINRRNLVNLISVKQISLSFFNKIGSYSVMALMSAVLMPLVMLAIRSYIIDNLGYKDAGLWEAMTRISKYYLMFITSLTALYILPRFTELDGVKAFKKEVFNFYKSVMPFFAVFLLLIYFFKHFIVLGVFSYEFKPVEDLFLWQILGDFIKVLSIVIAYQFLAKKMFWHYVITELFLLIILYLTSIYLVDYYGLEGAVIAHFISYLMYFGLILLIFGSSLFGVDSMKNVK
jgi:O-antigen/teichoic acid export membrane protein